MQPKPKPIRRTGFGITSRTNVPYDQPLTPGLRRQTTNAIGFLHDAYAEHKPDVFDLMNEGLTASEILERLHRESWRDRMTKRD